MPSEPRIRSVIDIALWRQRADVQPLGPCLPVDWQRFELVTAGRAWVRDGADEIVLGPGSLVWDGGGEPCIHRSDPRNPFSAFLVTVQLAGNGRRDGPRVSRWEDVAGWRRFSDEMLACWAAGRPAREATGRLTYATLRFRALAHAATISQAAWPEPIQRAVRLIDAGYAEDLGVADLAAAAGLSSARLHEAFRRHLGTSPHQHLLARRLEVARSLLREGDAGLEVIARQCGFGAVAAFCRAFRRVTGMTPGSYRKLR